MSKQLITFKLHLLSWPLPLHRYLAVCFMPITCLCGCAYLSFAASVCSCLICEPWFSVSLTQSYQVRLETNFCENLMFYFWFDLFSYLKARDVLLLFVDQSCVFGRGAGPLPGILCLPPLLAQCFCWDASVCRQNVLQGTCFTLVLKFGLNLLCAQCLTRVILTTRYRIGGIRPLLPITIALGM